ncbi:MAG: PqqD family protein [bacterium]|nr:PqqD family protein [bacterium]MDD6225345.1 PqqD family protein [bacterium]MDY3861576.1 PqqD family protein [Ruminococcus sp.]
MKIKGDFVLRKIADSVVVVPVGATAVDFGSMLNLNETGAFLFELLQKSASKEELLASMLNEYDVTSEKAEADIDKFINKLKDADILD